MTGPRGRGALVAGAAAVFGLPAAVAGALARSRPDHLTPQFLIVLLGCLAAGVIAAALIPARRAERALPLFALGILVLWPETALRANGFRYDPSRMVIEFGLTRPEHMAGLLRDPLLFWRLAPGTEGVNALGFTGPEVAIPKPPGVWRILFFGDSCTWQGFPAGVPKLLGRRLAARVPPDARVIETANLGVPGYSSFQGARLAGLVTGRLEPDLAVVVYGWNDHWLASGATDAVKGRGRGRIAGALAAAVTRSRLLQLALKLSGSGNPKPLDVPRVSPDEYRANLEAIGAAAEAAGARVLLATAPSPHARTGVPADLVERHLAASARDVVAWHRRYNEIVRAVARARGWPLADLEARADSLPDPAAVFLEDGIHYTTPRGLAWVADAVADAIARDVLPPPAPAPAGEAPAAAGGGG